MVSIQREDIELVIKDWKPEYGVPILRYFIFTYYRVNKISKGKMYNNHNMIDELLKPITEKTVSKEVMSEFINDGQYPLAIDSNGDLLLWYYEHVEINGRVIDSGTRLAVFVKDLDY